MTYSIYVWTVSSLSW